MNGFWDSCLTHFEKQLSAQQFNTWIKPLRLENAVVDGGELRLVAPNRFVMQWVRERFLTEIEEISRKLFTDPVAIALTLSEQRADAAQPVNHQAPAAPRMMAQGTQVAARPLPVPASEKTRLNPGFTFDNLVTGKANQLARAASVQV